ncbi:MAG: hypothetical protein OHK0029_17780 [Armatimonadaceae bacterium]
MASPLLNRVVFIFSVLGLVIAGYLWNMHSHPQDIPCGGSHGCADVANSPYSRFPVGWGPPVAMYGTLGYLALAALSILRTLPSMLGRDRLLLGLSIFAAGFGTLFSLYLTYAEAFLIKNWCKWCVGSQFIILIILVLTVVQWAQLYGRKAQSAA